MQKSSISILVFDRGKITQRCSALEVLDESPADAAGAGNRCDRRDCKADDGTGRYEIVERRACDRREAGGRVAASVCIRDVFDRLIRCASKGKLNLFRFDFLTCVT